MEDGELKKSFNIYLYYWTIPAFIVLLIINFLVPIFKIDFLNLGLMISAVSFLFGFLITITFSLLLTKNSTLKNSLSEETGRLISIYLLSKSLGSKFHERVRELIDSYVMITLKNYTHYETSREFNYGLYDNSLMEIKTQIQKSAANSYYYVLGEFQNVREKLESITTSRIERSIKFIDYLLGGVLISLLFLNRGDFFSNMLFVILSTAIIFIFLIVEDYDNLKIGDYTYNISNSEQIFDLIEKDRYYPKEILGRAKLETGRFYRIGVIDPKTREEKIFRLKYNPAKFKLKMIRISNLVKNPIHKK